MRYLFTWLLCLASQSWAYKNESLDQVPLQLRKFKMEHPDPIGYLSSSVGLPVDIRQLATLNTNVFTNPFFTEQILHMDKERIPERVVHAKGAGAHGYFEVTHDVSKYIKTDMFNGIGKRTPAFGRFSVGVPNRGGSELGRDSKALAVKFYSEEGNLDLLCLHHPVYFYRNPNDFVSFAKSRRRNPQTNILDTTAAWDFRVKRPDTIHALLWLASEYGIPDGYRKMDIFPIHTYEIYNNKGEKFYVRFNFRTEQGLANITSAEAAAVASQDPDYYTRDLYNAIANKNYPSWILEMDLLTKDDLTKVSYNPFDVIKMWDKGTYRTITIGRLTFNRNVDNWFAEAEQSAMNPANLVPGISGPMDFLFTSRVVSYRDTQDNRLGVNHNRIEINRPRYAKHYLRDGVPPVIKNMKNAPNYVPNTFSGPLPVIDDARPSQRLVVLESNAVDFGHAAEFYNYVLKTEDQRIVLAQNLAQDLSLVQPPVRQRGIEILGLVNPVLGKRVADILRNMPEKRSAPTLDTYRPLARCMEVFT